MHTAANVFMRRYRPFLADLFQLVGREDHVGSHNLKTFFTAHFVGNIAAGIIFTEAADPTPPVAPGSPGHALFTRLTRRCFSAEAVITCDVGATFDGDGVEGACTVDVAHYSMLTSMQSAMDEQTKDDGPVLIPMFPVYANGFMDNTVETHMRGLMKALCLQATSSAAARPYRFAKYMSPSLTMEQALAQLVAESSQSADQLYRGIIWLGKLLETEGMLQPSSFFFFSSTFSSSPPFSSWSAQCT